MSNGVNVLPEIIGVIGTLLGTVLGWLLSSLSQRGKLSIYPTWRDKFQHNDNYGGMVDSNSRDESKLYTYYITLEIYNSSGEPTIMRKIEVIFARNREELFRDTPDDDSTKRSYGSFQAYDNIMPITIPAKSVYTVKMHGGLWCSEERFSRLWETNKIMLYYRDSKNTEQKILLKNEDFRQYFDNHPVKEEE